MAFRLRADQMHSYCYEGSSSPRIQIDEAKAVWFVDPGEFWGTGDYDKITRFVLAAHRFRIQAILRPQDDKIRVCLESRGHAPDSPLEHHPGLSDLIARAYQLGGKRSDADLLVQAREIIREMLFSQHSEEDPIYSTAIEFLNEVKSR